MLKEYAKPPIQEDVTKTDEYIEISNNIKSFWTCEHDFLKCLVTMADGRQSIKNVCRACGKAEAAESKKKFSPDELSKLHPTTTQGLIDFRQTRQDQYYELCQTRDELRSEALSNHRLAWWSWYSEYLLTDSWKALRIKVLKRAGGFCEACMEKKAEQVHHVSYKHVGNEPLWDLRAVCHDCHEALHSCDESQHD